MAENKTSQITAEKSSTNKSELSAEHTRRNFLKKYGKLAVVTPVALTTLMSPKTSAAQSSTSPACQKKNPPKWCANFNSAKKNSF
ncbi:hypothetical protein RI844_07250 [Thalassotalea fonticola]|uniref:Twin-arginine translocation signal domain-containing protein n=1 Tax=Thalassotalea fonticola TaxID=3065649 RepID=A0ABZ0GTI5_9GAMM|nr:hypothetical protein RI844_07250 [Colwelliaceae bacterium S1-1]